MRRGYLGANGPIREAQVDSIDLEGRGVARVDGKVAFIEGAIIGERVRWRATIDKTSYAVGRVVEIACESNQRVRPRCPSFGYTQGGCGGCSMQHISSATQLAVKQRALEDALWHIGRVRPSQMLRPISGSQWGYRYRARLSVRDVARKGGVLVGFRERGSSHVADMHECRVLTPRVSGLLLPLRALISRLSMRDRLPQVEVAQAGDAEHGAVALVFRMLQPPTDADRELLGQFGYTHRVAIWLQPAGPDSAQPMTLDDDVDLAIELEEFSVRIPFNPTDFTQVNHEINTAMVRLALGLLDCQTEDKVLDLFCGLGNFTLPLAQRAKRVLGVEGSENLLVRAREAARINGLSDKVDFSSANLFEMTAERWSALHDRLNGIDRVLLDPPREGAAAVAQALSSDSRRPKRVVYVSCNPSTLARDCAIFVHQGGWKLRSAGVIDMFPHTSHVESIVCLEKA